MVEDSAVECFGSAGEAPGRAHIAFARRRIAAGMIVSKNYPGAPENGRVADNRAEREVHPRFVAVVMGEVKTVQLAIDVGDPQALKPGIGLGYAAGKECPGCEEAPEVERKFGTLISHAPRLKDIGFANDWN